MTQLSVLQRQCVFLCLCNFAPSVLPPATPTYPLPLVVNSYASLKDYLPGQYPRILPQPGSITPSRLCAYNHCSEGWFRVQILQPERRWFAIPDIPWTAGMSLENVASATEPQFCHL